MINSSKVEIFGNMIMETIEIIRQEESKEKTFRAPRKGILRKGLQPKTDDKTPTNSRKSSNEKAKEIDPKTLEKLLTLIENKDKTINVKDELEKFIKELRASGHNVQNILENIKILKTYMSQQQQAAQQIRKPRNPQFQDQRSFIRKTSFKPRMEFNKYNPQVGFMKKQNPGPNPRMMGMYPGGGQPMFKGQGVYAEDMEKGMNQMMGNPMAMMHNNQNPMQNQINPLNNQTIGNNPMENRMTNQMGNPQMNPNPMERPPVNPMGNPMGGQINQINPQINMPMNNNPNNVQMINPSNGSNNGIPDKGEGMFPDNNNMMPIRMPFNQGNPAEIQKKTPFMRGGNPGYPNDYPGNFSGGAPYKKPHFDFYPHQQQQQPHHQNPHFARNFETPPPQESPNNPFQEQGEHGEISKKPHFKNPYKPQNYKTVPCRFFHSNIGCPRGEECHFIHDYNYMGVETPNMHKYVRPLNQLSHNSERNQRNMLLYGHLAGRDSDEERK